MRIFFDDAARGLDDDSARAGFVRRGDLAVARAHPDADELLRAARPNPGNHVFLQVLASRFQPGGTLDHLRSWCDQQRAATSPETATRLVEIGWNTDVREAARKIKCPVLVLHPERDRVVPVREGRSLVNLIPGSRFIGIDSGNHIPLPDDPAWSRLLSEVRAFLAEPVAALPARFEDLTPRELAVLDGIAEGMDNAELAESLSVSEKTVRNHITRVFDKIRVKHRYEAIVLARDAGLGRARTGTSVPRA